MSAPKQLVICVGQWSACVGYDSLVDLLGIEPSDELKKMTYLWHVYELGEYIKVIAECDIAMFVQASTLDWITSVLEDVRKTGTYAARSYDPAVVELHIKPPRARLVVCELALIHSMRGSSSNSKQP